MPLLPLGKVTVPTHGTRVHATKNLNDDTRNVFCHAYLIQVLPTNTGKVYVGDSTLNVATLVGVMGILGVPTTSAIPAFSATISYTSDGLNLKELYIDADVDGEGAIVAAIVA